MSLFPSIRTSQCAAPLWILSHSPFAFLTAELYTDPTDTSPAAMKFGGTPIELRGSLRRVFPDSSLN